jgi:hypothetical protein
MFSVKQHMADTELEPFPYEDADGQPTTLPHLKTLSTAQALRVFARGELAEVLAEVVPDQVDALMAMPAHALDALSQAWLTHSGVQFELGQPVGKSSSSSPSSTSTAKRLKRTSVSVASKSRR